MNKVENISATVCLSNPYKAKNIQTKKEKRFYINNFNTISFRGNKNPKQVAVVAMEAEPIVKYGGVADVIGSLTPELNKLGLDARVFLPMYDSQRSLKKKSTNVYTYTNKNNQTFNLEKTGLSVEFDYGFKHEKANLYKVNDPKVPYRAYLIECPNTISKQSKAYQGEMSQQTSNNQAFCTACLEILKHMENSSEKFNPKFLNSNDWVTAFISEKQGLDNRYNDNDELKVLHTFHNAGYYYQGRVSPSIAAANVLPRKKVENVLDKEETRQKIQQINKAVNELIAKLQELSLSRELSEGDYRKALVKIADNYDSYNRIFEYETKSFDVSLINSFPHENWTSIDYNPSLTALRQADIIATVSKEYLKDVQRQGDAAPGLENDFRAATWKSAGITNGLDIKNYNPSVQNPSLNKQIASLYSKNNLRDGKTKNKLYLQGELSYDAALNKYNRTFGCAQYGYLKQDSDAFVGMLISRFSPEQKGIDILIECARDYLDQNPKAQLILGGPDFNPDNHLVADFVRIANDYPGRVVLCDGFIKNMNQLFAGSDAVIMPNRFAPCEILQLQAMRYGCVPIASNLGGMKEIIIDFNDDKQNATGFKTKKPLNEVSLPAQELLSVLCSAYNIFETNPNEWLKISKNAMDFRRDWSDVASEYKKLIFDNPITETSIQNLYNLDDKVTRGSQPGKCRGENLSFETNEKSLESDIRFLKKEGYTTIIDLRNKDSEGKYPELESAYANKHGLEYVNIPMNASNVPSEAQINKFLNAIDKSTGRVFFHCRAGADRTGIMSCIYLVSRHHLSPSDAVEKSFDDVGIKRFKYMHPYMAEETMNLLENMYICARNEHQSNNEEIDKLSDELARMKQMLDNIRNI